MAAKSLKILLLAAEVAPFAKVGGLADVAGALPKALSALGHDVRVAMPAYKMIEDNPDFAVQNELEAFPVPIRDSQIERAYVKRTRIQSAHTPDIPVYLIGHQPAGKSKGYFQQATESKKVYLYAPEPYVFFARAALEMLPRLSPDWIPDVLHCNDWHTGMTPVFQRYFYADSPVISRPATVFTVHNLAYQGNFTRDQWPVTGLPESLYTFDKLEFYGQWTFMKGGLVFADRINTVSQTYAKEIQTPEYGCGLDGLMHYLSDEGKLSGIVNGIDYEEFNPETDPHIAAHFSAKDLSGKARCKSALQAELGLPPSEDAVIGMVSRLADQKGLDLIHAVAEKMLDLPIQLVILGTGDPNYEKYFKKLQTRHPARVAARIRFDLGLAQRIYAGSDLFLMPSRFEPCGLGQLISLRYGTIPMVRATGGLADTVTDFTLKTSSDGNGFVFVDYTPEALLATVQRAVATYQMKEPWGPLVQHALHFDSSWARSARRYAALYAEAIQSRARSPHDAGATTG